MQNFCAMHGKYYKIFVPLLKKFYNDDVISEENIVGWWKSPVCRVTAEEVGGEKNLALRKAAEEVDQVYLGESGELGRRMTMRMTRTSRTDGNVTSEWATSSLYTDSLRS